MTDTDKEISGDETAVESVGGWVEVSSVGLGACRSAVWRACGWARVDERADCTIG